MKTHLITLASAVAILLLSTTQAFAQSKNPPAPTATPATPVSSALNKALQPKTNFKLAGNLTTPVEFGTIDTYEHVSGWFSINMPTNWDATDNSTKGKEVEVTFTDPSGNSALTVMAFPYAEEMTDDDLANLMTKVVKDRVGSQKKFSAGKPQMISEGLVGVAYGYDVTSKGKAIKMVGESYMRHADQKLLTMLTWIVPQEQYEKTKTQMYALMDTFTPHADALDENKSNGTKLVIDELKTYKHKSGAFKIDVPADWEADDNSTPGSVFVTFAQASGNSAIIINLTKNKGATLKSKDLEGLVTGFVGLIVGKNEDFAADKAKSDGNTASVTFSYTSPTKNGSVPMRGIAYADQVDKTISYFVILVPEASVEANAEKIDEIDKSYSVTKSAKF
jgi:hypothetical protein